MQKRGQIYILAVIILGAIVFTLALKPNLAVQEVIEDDFERLSEQEKQENEKKVREYNDYRKMFDGSGT